MGTSEPIAPLPDTAAIPPEWIWTIALAVICIAIVAGVAKVRGYGGLKTIRLAFGVAVPSMIPISIIWWPDGVRWFAAIVLAVVMLGFVLALWKIPRSGPWGGWLFGAIVLAILLVISTWSLWPLESNEFLWFGLPLMLPAAVASLIGSLVLRHRRIVKREAAAALRAKRSKVAALLRAKLNADTAKENARRREETRRRDIAIAEADAKEDARRHKEARRRDIVVAEADARRTAYQQDDDAGLTKTRHQVRRLRRVLKKLWKAVRGVVDRGVRLEYLAQRSRLSVEQTYAAVCILEDRKLVSTNRNDDREKLTDLWVYLGRKGAEEVERKAVKDVFNVGHLGDQFGPTVNVVGDKNRVAHVNVGATSSEESLAAVLESVQALRVQLKELPQIEALDAQVEELKKAKDEPAKRSALERLKAVASALGPLAKPLLDIVNGAINNPMA